MGKIKFLNENEIQRALNIKSFSEITMDSMKKLIEMKAEIDPEMYKHIIDQIPNVISVIREINSVLKEEINSSTKKSLKNKDLIEEIIKSVSNITQNPNLASEEILEVTKLLEKALLIVKEMDENERKDSKEYKENLMKCGMILIGIVGIALTGKNIIKHK